MDFKPTIIGVAEATHYLVGGTDVDDNFTALPALGDVVICNSLSSAKQLLRDNDMLEAQLTLQTPYDEMCGLPTSRVTHETVLL
ncbi:DUF6482 family protein [Pseudocolwellia sp. AS88]|jgi:hypothetical protein|uniref:DUF6482 family protein n=1 Tax=Pseudocolwellia TaxID=2848177 RepID=UPI0026F32D78|nr:DUF6482 family protein [Pseudocolwellia sp. AS88]MDO7086618.1 DUF6482 family protein [Pseudocolwellia sp. AS88]